MKKSIVSISESAFFTIISTALESYKLEHQIHNGEMGDRVETFGHLWGYSRYYNTPEQVYRVVWADTSTAVIRDKSYVAYDNEAQSLKQDFVDTFFPEVSYLGDYHSHPYSTHEDEVKTELALERNGLYQFSKGDFEAVKNLHENEYLDYRVGLVVTVYEREDKITRHQKRLDGESCIRFQYSGMTIWIKAYIWEEKNLKYKRKPCNQVKLICPSLEIS